MCRAFLGGRCNRQAIATVSIRSQTDGGTMGNAVLSDSTSLGTGAVSTLPTNPDTLLTRARTAQSLTASGLPMAAETLATKATRGGGPPYRLFSGRALYRWGDALAWALAKLTPPRRTTSEADAKAVIDAVIPTTPPNTTKIVGSPRKPAKTSVIDGAKQGQRSTRSRAASPAHRA
jgi:hypothetical protein